MKKIIMTTLFSYGFLMCQAQNNERLTNMDLKETFTDMLAQKFMQEVATFSQKNDQEIETYFKNPANENAQKEIEAIMGFREANKEFRAPFKASRPHLYLDERQEREQMQDIFFKNHLRLACADRAVKKSKALENSEKSQFKNVATNIFFGLGSCVTYKKHLTKDRFNAFIDNHCVSPEDCETRKILGSYQNSFCKRKGELAENIDSEVLTRSMAYTVASNSQSAFYTWEKKELENDPEYKAQTIKNGKTVALGMGIAAIGTAAWLWSKQASK